MSPYISPISPAQLDPATLATVQPEVRDLGLPSLLGISFFGAHPELTLTLTLTPS